MMIPASSLLYAINSGGHKDNNDAKVYTTVAKDNEGPSRCSSSFLDESKRFAFSRKRRPVNDDEGESITEPSNNLTSINSGFLAGLFDDVTKINVLKELKLSDPAADEANDSSNNISEVSSKTTSNNELKLLHHYPSITSLPARTVSPSSYPKHSIDETEAAVDPLHLLESISTVSTTSSCRPSKKSRLSMIDVPSLNGLDTSSSTRSNLSRTSYWSLTERSSAFQEQSKELLASLSTTRPTVVGDSRVAKTLTGETALNRLFSQVTFLDDNNDSFSSDNIHLKDNSPATMALDALMETERDATSSVSNNSNNKSRMIKASTCNKFPNLPCFISEASWDKSRMMSRTKSATGTGTGSDSEELSSFGWFVDTDEDVDDYRPAAAPVPVAPSNPGDLAFQAPTAPKGRSIQDDAEIEWAKAADTVDSVLGDMF
ncbi:hypothetical protein IV203_013842 [Nitzschia inconspicua]|uniref:Uncharacterized protein n=1 Tax=Nitzschia inconspicua TaxID=303405 RepID=A0A9K3M691_9STRA|nr:hypothetical protein IV203_014199 [Nitzschia inconspicua]KAG7374747.1 hypothetical protein IV203_013842 [Nitzschia inconspicua]